MPLTVWHNFAAIALDLIPRSECKNVENPVNINGYHKAVSYNAELWV
jgi:hypothetical protein